MTAFTRTRSLAGLILTIAIPLMAHHPFASEYDATKPVTLKGVVDRVQWENPHVHIVINVKNNNGKTDDWQLEAASPVYLEKQGIRESMFPKGKVITVHGYRASDGPRLASARIITAAEGRTYRSAIHRKTGDPQSKHAFT
jgi:hypothetical protein